MAVKRNAWAAVVISLSIVARPESIVIIPAFALLLFSLNQWKKIPLLTTGMVIFSLLGYWGFDKPLSWVFIENTYSAASPYGHGAFNTFIKHSDLIFGYFLIPSLVGATLLMVIRFRQIKSPALRKTANICRVYHAGNFNTAQPALVEGPYGLCRSHKGNGHYHSFGHLRSTLPIELLN
ncbi:MAG: hypothetical protein U5L96_15730 [Owenweeksia sp.]|nr:hypothetical protein [Owenweeksia sp.]